MSRDTTTGLKFEAMTHVKATGVDVSKNALYAYLKTHGIDYTTIISRKILPDEAYYNEDTHTLLIYEKKFQKTEGSADEKPQTCGFKIHQFKKIGAAFGATTVKYIYILSDWFKQKKYQDMLDYIRMVPDCDYMFQEEAGYAS